MKAHVLDRIIDLRGESKKNVIVGSTLHHLLKVESANRRQKIEHYIRDLVYADLKITENSEK